MAQPQTKTCVLGETIFQEGDPGTEMYVVKEGEVDLFLRGKILKSLKKGDIFGEMAIIDNSPRSATARARTDCELMVINQERFLTLVHQNPNFALEVMKVLAERLRLTNERMGDVRQGG